MSILDWTARQRLVRAITGDTGVSYRELGPRETGRSTLNTVVMPAMATDGSNATQWFSKLLDECYFRLPQFKDDLKSYHANCEGEDKQNLAVIYADVIRQQTQLFRQGKLIGADEYAEDAHKARCVLTSDPRVNAWQAFDAYARKQLHMSSTDYGMELQLDDEAKALFDELVKELGALYTEGARTPAENFEVASKACKILFKEEHQNNANESSSDGDGEDGEVAKTAQQVMAMTKRQETKIRQQKRKLARQRKHNGLSGMEPHLMNT